MKHKIRGEHGITKARRGGKRAKKVPDPEIEESETSFAYPEAEPEQLFSVRYAKLYEDFKVLGDAVDELKGCPDLDDGLLGRIQIALDTFGATLDGVDLVE